MKGEIRLENRIGTLDQIKGSVEVLEKQIEKQMNKGKKDIGR